MRTLDQQTKDQRAVTLWIFVVAGFVLLMVGIGGVTRLTGSGLSITEWAPLMGAIPPLTESAWVETFARYKSSPQFQLVNFAMTLDQFKHIFFWEYFHRLIGRSIGLVFFIPWAWFWYQKKIGRREAWILLAGFFLGGLQGLMGWLMVKSGLVDVPRVSHYRLAAHLMLALLIFTYFIQVGLRQLFLVSANHHAAAWQKVSKVWNLLFSALLIQIIYGALVAGLKAGFAFNTFPLMDGKWIPNGFLYRDPLLINFLENPASVQWIHRWFGIFVFLLAIIFARTLKSAGPFKRVGRAIHLFFGLQILLGVVTLLTTVFIPIAVLHQMMAFALVGILMWAKIEILNSPDPSK